MIIIILASLLYLNLCNVDAPICIYKNGGGGDCSRRDALKKKVCDDNCLEFDTCKISNCYSLDDEAKNKCL